MMEIKDFPFMQDSKMFENLLSPDMPTITASNGEPSGVDVVNIGSIALHESVEETGEKNYRVFMK